MILQRKHLLILLPVTVWLVLYSWRPFYLGFYHDDWSVFVYPHTQGANLWEYLAWLKNRFGFALSLFGIISLWDGSSFTIHAFFAIGWGLSALIMFFLVREVIYFNKSKNISFPPFFASAIWLSIPWAMGYTAFLACAVIALPCVIGFMICMWSYLRYTQGRGLVYAIISCGGLVLSYANYESFYISFIGICAVSIWLNWRNKSFSWKRELIGIAGLFLVQVFFIFLAKSLSPKTLIINTDLCIHNFYMTRDIFINAMRAILPKRIVTLLLFALLVLYLTSIWKDWKNNKNIRNSISVAIVLFIVLISLLLSTLPYSIAQYGLIDIGCSSRTTLSFTFWFCLGSGILAAAICQYPSWFGMLAKTIFCCFLLIFVILAFNRSQDWIKVVKLQNEILAKMPMEEISKAPEQTVFLVNNDRFYNNVEVFGAPWDISSAMFVRHPNLAKSKKWNNGSSFVPIYDWYIPRWNGKVLEILKGYELQALHVYKIDLQTGKMTPYPKTDF